MVLTFIMALAFFNWWWFCNISCIVAYVKYFTQTFLAFAARIAVKRALHQVKEWSPVYQRRMNLHLGCRCSLCRQLPASQWQVLLTRPGRLNALLTMLWLLHQLAILPLLNTIKTIYSHSLQKYVNIVDYTSDGSGLLDLFDVCDGIIS